MARLPRCSHPAAAAGVLMAPGVASITFTLCVELSPDTKDGFGRDENSRSGGASEAAPAAAVQIKDSSSTPGGPDSGSFKYELCVVVCIMCALL